MHNKVVCPDCEKVVMQCRCIGPHTIVHERCEGCLLKFKEKTKNPEVFAWDISQYGGIWIGD